MLLIGLLCLNTYLDLETYYLRDYNELRFKHNGRENSSCYCCDLFRIFHVKGLFKGLSKQRRVKKCARKHCSHKIKRLVKKCLDAVMLYLCL